jgi:hypothetical protein
MARGETPRSENTETSPEEAAERAMGDAVATIESRDATDPIISEKWGQKAKDFFQNPNVQPFVDTARVGSFTFLKIFWNILVFAKRAVEKSGKISFKEGYELGQSAINPEDAKK